MSAEDNYDPVEDFIVDFRNPSPTDSTQRIVQLVLGTIFILLGGWIAGALVYDKGYRTGEAEATTKLFNAYHKMAKAEGFILRIPEGDWKVTKDLWSNGSANTPVQETPNE